MENISPFTCKCERPHQDPTQETEHKARHQHHWAQRGKPPRGHWDWKLKHSSPSQTSLDLGTWKTIEAYDANVVFWRWHCTKSSDCQVRVQYGCLTGGIAPNQVIARSEFNTDVLQVALHQIKWLSGQSSIRISYRWHCIKSSDCQVRVRSAPSNLYGVNATKVGAYMWQWWLVQILWHLPYVFSSFWCLMNYYTVTFDTCWYMGWV